MMNVWCCSNPKPLEQTERWREGKSCSEQSQCVSSKVIISTARVIRTSISCLQHFQHQHGNRYISSASSALSRSTRVLQSRTHAGFAFARRSPFTASLVFSSPPCYYLWVSCIIIIVFFFFTSKKTYIQKYHFRSLEKIKQQPSSLHYPQCL